MRYSYYGGRPPPSHEEFTIDTDGTARYLAAHPWPKQPPFDEVGLYMGRADSVLLEMLAGLGSALDAVGEPAISSDSGSETLELSCSDQVRSARWDGNQTPASMRSPLTALRASITQLRSNPLFALRARLELEAAHTLVLVLDNPGTQALRCRSFAHGEAENGRSTLQLCALDTEDWLESPTSSPVRALAAPRAWPLDSMLASGEWFELAPQQVVRTPLTPDLDALVAPAVRSVRVEALLGVELEAAGWPPLSRGWVLTESVRVERTPAAE